MRKSFSRGQANSLKLEFISSKITTALHGWMQMQFQVFFQNFLSFFIKVDTIQDLRDTHSRGSQNDVCDMNLRGGSIPRIWRIDNPRVKRLKCSAKRLRVTLFHKYRLFGGRFQSGCSNCIGEQNYWTTCKKIIL